MGGKFRFSSISLAFEFFRYVAFASILACTAQSVLAQEAPSEQERNQEISGSAQSTEKANPKSRVITYDELWETKRRSIEIDGTSYSPGELIEDFLNVAFSEGVWNEDANLWNPDMFSKIIDRYGPQNLDLQDKDVRKEYEEKKIAVPWLADYMYRPDGWPKHNVTHRWNKEITIGIGWPRYKINGPKTNLITSVYDQEWTAALYPSIAEHIKKQLPAIERSTGLSAKFISPDDPDDATREYARIRIIPKRTLERRTSSSMLGYQWYPHQSEELLWGGVLFETSTPKEMDAYLLPEVNNQPGLVICKIDGDLPEALFSALITECLVRAVGLPGRGGRPEKAVLGPWRSQVGPDHPENSPVSSAKNLPQTLTPYDEWMISLLYCPSIKSGMDKNQVLQALTSKKDKCISQHLYP